MACPAKIIITIPTAGGAAFSLLGGRGLHHHAALHGEGLLHLDFGLWQLEVHCILLLPMPVPGFCSLQYSQAAVSQVLLFMVKG